MKTVNSTHNAHTQRTHATRTRTTQAQGSRQAQRAHATHTRTTQHKATGQAQAQASRQAQASAGNARQTREVHGERSRRHGQHQPDMHDGSTLALACRRIQLRHSKQTQPQRTGTGRTATGRTATATCGCGLHRRTLPGSPVWVLRHRPAVLVRSPGATTHVRTG